MSVVCFLGVAGCGGSSDTKRAAAPSEYAQVVPDSGAADDDRPADRGSEPSQSAGDRGSDNTILPADSDRPSDPPAADPAAEPAGQSERAADSGDEPASDPQAAPKEPGQVPDHPFPNRMIGAEFPKDLNWINTSGPLRKRDLKGKFVLLDFWTYCCINCIHILPELKKLEHAYPNELVVIGVHSAKFDNEKISKNIAEAVLRYEIEHPVVNDAEHQIWDAYYCRSWPSLRIVDPEGNLVAGHSGEFDFEMIDAFLKDHLPYYRERGLLDERPLRFDLLAGRQAPTPLRFPGKVLADAASGRLFISDSNHNRIVITSLDGALIDVVGSGRIGRDDGDYASASFDHPQGVALHGHELYVSDTENHMLRLVDLEQKTVRTVAGTGEQGTGWPGLDDLKPDDPLPTRFAGPPSRTKLNSPWALWIHGSDLFIAMAGPHQIWRMPLDESEIGPYAGNGREDIVDGALLPERPYDTGLFTDPVSAFAQPSGLASDGTWLYVADSEGSSIRAVPFDTNERVRTVVGTANLRGGRLFVFGDQDGARDDVLLQHALGVAYAGGKLYIADTYNNKIKVIDAATGETRTLAGTGQPGRDDAAPEFDEPAGVSVAGNFVFVADTNNHLIRKVAIDSGQVTTLAIAGLEPPNLPREAPKPDFAGADVVEVPAGTIRPADGQIRFDVALAVPDGWKLSPDAPIAYLVEVAGAEGPIDRQALTLTELERPTTPLAITVPATGNGTETLTLSMNFYYCADGGEGLCKSATVQFRVTLDVDDTATQESVKLEYRVD